MRELDFKIQLLLSLSREISGTLNENQIFRFISNSLRTLFTQISWLGLLKLEPETQDIKPIGKISAEKIIQNRRFFERLPQFRDYILLEKIEADYIPFSEESRSCLWIPLRRWERIQGFLGIEAKVENGFKSEDIVFIRIIGDFLGVALSNTYLFQKNEERFRNFQTAYEVSLAINKPLPKEKLIENFLNISGKHFKCVYVAYFEVKGELLELFTYYSEDPELEPSNLQIPLGKGLVGNCAQERKGSFINDVDKSSQYLMGVKGVLSEMVIPVILGEDLSGVIDFGRKDPFNQETLSLGELLVNTLSISIQNAFYYQELQKFATRMEEKVKEKSDELVKSEKFALIGQMTSVVVHELRNLLAGISSMGDLLVLKIPDSKLKEMAEVMKEEAHKATEQLNSILNFARPLRLSYEKRSLIEVLERALEIARPVFEDREIKVVKKYDKNIDDVMMDPDRVKEVLVNLIRNAAQAIEEKGTIILSIYKEDKQIVLSVKDTGVGIPKEVQHKIFEPFWTTKLRGTGVGLAQVKKILDYHRWKVNLESGKGKGTTFTIYIPVPRSEFAKVKEKP